MAEEGFGGFGDWFNTMNPQGNPLELASMLQHDPEGIIPQLVAEGITPQQFESRFGASGGGFTGGGDMTSGQLLSGSGVLQRYPQFDESRAPAGGLGAAAPGTSAPLVPTPVQTLSIPRPVAPAPAQAAVAAPEPAVAAPGAVAAQPTAEYGVPGGQAGPPNPADQAQAKGSEADKKQMADLVKLLAGVKAPAPPVVQLPRPGTAGPPAVRPINPQSAISALLQQALGGGRAAPSLSSVVRR